MFSFRIKRNQQDGKLCEAILRGTNVWDELNEVVDLWFQCGACFAGVDCNAEVCAHRQLGVAGRSYLQTLAAARR
jgi:hypothetical protein